MTIQTITLADIRAAAQNLANRRNDTLASSTLLNAEIKSAIGPILERYQDTLDTYASAEAAAMKALDDLLAAAPHLFIKPRSLTVDGVRSGYKREPDMLDWADEADVIGRIKSLRPDLVPLLVRTVETLVVDALGGLEADDQRAFGIRTVTGIDRRFITLGDNDVEKITKAIVTDATRRQGEDEAPAKARGKAKVGKAVTA